jgi:hypothetical protein
MFLLASGGILGSNGLIKKLLVLANFYLEFFLKVMVLLKMLFLLLTIYLTIDLAIGRNNYLVLHGFAYITLYLLLNNVFYHTDFNSA